MNAQTHRLIFNTARGCLMAVAETSRSCGKSSASGASKSTRTKHTHRQCQPLPAPATSDTDIYKQNTHVAQVTTWLHAIEFIVTKTSTSNAGSQLTAGRNVQITATGTDASNPNSGNLNIIGSNVSAGNNVALKASKDVNIVSAQDTEAHQTDHSDWTVGAGVGVAASSSGGTSMGVTGNVGVGVATQKSQASTQLNSHITAGNKLSVESTRDTNIQGGVLSADSVNVDVGPDTTIEETLFGMRVPGKGAGAVVQVTERNTASALVGTAKAAEEALLRSGGAFDKAGNPLLDMKALSTEQKGVMGDLFGQNTVKQIVPDGQKIARMPGVGETGLDDLYKVNRPDVDYVVIEYKFVGTDSKTGAQVLKNTNDGLQGSQSWIGGSGRIEKAVGTDQAIDVDKALRTGRTETWVVTTRSDGATEVQVLDAFGKPKQIDTSKIILPKKNPSGAQP